MVVALFAFEPPLLEVIELNWLDLRFRARGVQPPGPAVVLAAIDEKSLDAEGRWPWPRGRIARLVDALSADGARVIAFDVLFSEPVRGAEAEDRSLAEALKRATAPVVLGYFFHLSEASVGYPLERAEIERRLRLIAGSRYPVVRRSAEAPASPFIRAYAPQGNLEAFAAAAPSSGYFSIPADIDGVVRWMALALQGGEDVYAPLALLAAWHYLGKPPLEVLTGPYGMQGVRLAERTIPTDEEGRLLINFRGPARTYPAYSITDILEGRLRPGTFRDRIVVIGATAIGIGDIRNTPFGPVYPGPEIQASAIDNILAGDFIERPRWSRIFDLLAIVGLGLLVGLALPRTSALAGLLITGALLLVYVTAAYLLFARYRVWLNMVYPVLALAATYTLLTLYRYVVEERERKRVKAAFQHYVAPDVIELMLKEPEGVRLGGHEAVLTALITDLEGFTGYAERHTPSEIIGVLGDYYARMTEQIFGAQGTLVEYVGDEIFALFGAPVSQADHAARACACALAMREHRVALGEEWSRLGRPRLRARTGINTGTMLVGNVGSIYRFHYGAIGDPVNLASRLEALNKVYGTEIVLSDHTARLVGSAFLLRELDAVRVKGRGEALRVHELVGAAGAHLPHRQAEMLLCYAAALERYRAHDWAAALAAFRACRGLWPDDAPSRVMEGRCEAFRVAPPPADWDGTFEQLTK